MARHLVCSVCCLLAFAALTHDLPGQTTAGLSGVVTDTSGAKIPAVRLTITEEDTGVVFTTETNAAGVYAVPSLNPGRYRVVVQKDGFKQVDVRDLVLSVQDVVTRDFTMQLGQASQTVQVDASTEILNTTDSAVSTLIDRQFVENLPLNGRSFQTLLYLSPGVTFNFSADSQGDFVVNGQRNDANYWMIDGVSANIGMAQFDPGNAISGSIGGASSLGGTSSLVSVDALQEFRIETSTYSPEFGRATGGEVLIQTRSGTNQFHGTAFEFLRNTVLDSTDWFVSHYAEKKPAEIQNDFGGVLGGPVFKDRTFFFFSAEMLRLLQPTSFSGTVPDANARATATPAAKPYVDIYPLPQANATEACAGCGYVNYNTTFSEPSASNAFSLRLDHSLLKNLNLFARYNYAPSHIDYRGDGGPANYVITSAATTQTGTAGATWTISPSVVNDIRYNYSNVRGDLNRFEDSFGGGTPFPGADLFAPGLGYANSNIALDVRFGTNMTVSSGMLSVDYQRQNNFVDTLSMQKGAHNLKFGVDYRRMKPTVNFATEQLYPFFSSMAGMAAGDTSLTVIYYNPPMTYLFQNLGLYAQDTWHASSRLNLTYGLRWDVDYVPENLTGTKLIAAPLAGFSLTNLSSLGLAPAGTPPYHTRFGKVQPRVGGAFILNADPEWGRVVRGGFGLIYGTASTEVLNNTWNQGYYPVAGASVLGAGLSFPYVSPPALPAIVAPNSTNGGTLAGFDPNLDVPYALEWNVALQQSLESSQALTLTYVGATDRHLIASELINHPNPNYGAAALIAAAGSSNYQAMQVQFQRRMTHGLQMQLSYNWAHAIDTGTYGAYANGTFADINANRALSDNDIRNAFAAAFSYTVPVLRNNLFTRALTEGWATDDTIHIQGGPPVDIQDENFYALAGESQSIVVRPDFVPGQPLYLTGSQYPGRKAINPAAFEDPPIDPSTMLPVRQGDFARNSARALGWKEWDMTLRRDFNIYERLKLQFRASMYNVLGHPNFAPFNNAFETGNSSFGLSTEMLDQSLGGAAGVRQDALYAPGGPRDTEVALKLMF